MQSKYKEGYYLAAGAFSAIIEPRDHMLECILDGIPGVMAGLPASTAIHFADVVDKRSEYRAYVVDGELFWGQDRLDFVEEKLSAQDNGAL